MSLRTAVLALPIALVLAASFAVAAPDPVPRAAGLFDTQLDAMLAASQQDKKGLVFHVDGQAIPGGVKETSGDYVIVANQEHGRILIRRASIDAVAAN
jgi:hypothetical protein